MDRIGLARLIAYLCSLSRTHSFDRYEIGQIDSIITESLAQKPAAVVPSAADARLLLEAIASGRKIEAIKAFRCLTGDGLKESKDAVERVMDKMKPDHAQVA
jgi:ribosomal protein L7/L12